jgi:hypothetical protein
MNKDFLGGTKEGWYGMIIPIISVYIPKVEGNWCLQLPSPFTNQAM